MSGWVIYLWNFHPWVPPMAPTYLLMKSVMQSCHLEVGSCSTAVCLSLHAVRRCWLVSAAGERSLGIYKTYYWLTVFLFLLMFVMAAWFVCLVAVNTTGATSCSKSHVFPLVLRNWSHRGPSLAKRSAGSHPDIYLPSSQPLSMHTGGKTTDQE